MLDGIFLSKLVKELKEIEGLKINKIYQLGNDEFVFNLKGYENYKLLVSVNSVNYRIHLTNRDYQTPKEPSGFVMFLRKHLEGGVIKEIKQHSLDRKVIISVSKKNELRDLEEKKIIIELVGKSSNLIITNESFVIIDSLKHVLNIEDDKIVIPKSNYKLEINKKNIYEDDLEEVYSKKDFQEKFYGISPLIYEAYINNDNPNLFIKSLKDINIKPVLFKKDNKEDYYFTNLFNLNIVEYKTLSELLDEFYYNRALTSIIRQKTNNIEMTIKRLIERTKRKIENQSNELEASIKNEEYRLKGELLTANLYQLPKDNRKSVKALNYYTNEEVEIELDPLLSIKDNSLKFYNKYNKLKKALVHLKEQIEISKNELEYLELIQMQINHANIEEVNEIKKELINNKYLKEQKQEKKKDKVIPLTFLTSNNTEILVGKNNAQNEVITHKIAKHNELWFHVKTGPGSHVLLRKTEDFTEEEIRSAAMLAAYYSSSKESSSVEVIYTLRKNIKKIPGKRSCFVAFSNEKSIYIDPEEEMIRKMKRK